VIINGKTPLTRAQSEHYALTQNIATYYPPLNHRNTAKTKKAYSLRIF